MLPGNLQYDLYNRSTLQSEKYDDFSVVRNYGKLSAKCLLGILLVIEVGLLSYFLFLARTTARIRLNPILDWLRAYPILDGGGAKKPPRVNSAI